MYLLRKLNMINCSMIMYLHVTENNILMYKVCIFIRTLMTADIHQWCSFMSCPVLHFSVFETSSYRDQLVYSVSFTNKHRDPKKMSTDSRILWMSEIESMSKYFQKYVPRRSFETQVSMFSCLRNVTNIMTNIYNFYTYLMSIR